MASNASGERPLSKDLDRPANRGPWGEALGTLRSWDRSWAEICSTMTNNPWDSGVLPRKFVELVGVALNAACTNLDPRGARHHIRAALAAGASRDEVLMVLKMASLLAIHACSAGAPILLEEAAAAGRKVAVKDTSPTPACDAMKASGQWNEAWNPFFDLDPRWTDAFMATGVSIYAAGIFSAKEVELLSIAFDASYTHMYGPGTRRQIRGALAAGAAIEEIMEVLKLCVVQGVQACNLAVPILEQEMALLDDPSGAVHER